MTVFNYYLSEKTNEYFLSPNIPLDKLANALYKYVNLEQGERILALVDQSLFGSGKVGLVFTENRLIWKEILEEPKSLRYSNFQDVGCSLPTFSNEKLDSTLYNLFRELKEIYQFNKIENLPENKIENLDDADKLIQQIEMLNQICESCISLEPHIKNLNRIL